MAAEQQLRKILEELFEIATPGKEKESLWQAYQQIMQQTTPEKPARSEHCPS